MTHNVPSSQALAPNGDDSEDSASNIRRRLGNWTSAPVSTPEQMTAPFQAVSAPDATLPLVANSLSTDTVQLTPGPTGRSDQMMTMDLQQAVPVNATAPMQTPHTQPFEAMNPAIRARLDEQASRNMSYYTGELQAEAVVTVPFVTGTMPIQPGLATTTPISYQTGELPNQQDATMPFGSGMLTAPIGDQTASTVRFESGMLTAPIGDSGNATVQFGSGMLTAPIGDQGSVTVPFGSGSLGAQEHTQGSPTVPFGSGMLTAPIGEQGTSTVQFSSGMQTGPIPGSTGNLQREVSVSSEFGVSYTGIMGEETGNTGTLPFPPTATARMAIDPNATFPLPGGHTTASIGGTDEVQNLREQVTANPDDTDLVLELALALNEVGERAEAHKILTNLATLFESQGEHEQANRIRLMLGDAHTAPILNDPNVTQPMPRQTTDSLKPRTGTLGLRAVPASRDGRIAQRQKTDERERTVFPARNVTFTLDLPQIERLSEAATVFFSAAEIDRESGKYRSALDNLQMAVALDPSVPAAFLRMAEVQLKLGYRRKALETIEELRQFETLFRSGIPDWCFSRLLLHAEPFDLVKVQRLVDTMIEDGHAAIAAPYVARLVEHLVAGDRIEEATEYADRICGLAPGETYSTLEAAILSIKLKDRGRAIDRWEFALRNGADPIVGKASMAALVAESNESDHWRLLSDVIPAYRSRKDPILAEAYRRTAEAAGWSALHKAASSLFIAGKATAADRAALATAAGDRSGTPIGRAATAAALAHILQSTDRGDEYLASIRTTLNLFTDERVPDNVQWNALLGFTPTIDEMSYELGQELMKAGDAAGAVDVLKQGYALNKSHTKLTQALADAFARTSQLGSALTILDELAMSHRKAGRLDEMAAVLRQMSQLAPANIKVKSRLVDAYLQRGFVAEARAELIQRADLEERADMTKEAIVSLQRAADLSWNLGFPQESFNLYDRILALDPEDVANRSALVNLYLQVGRLSDAAEHQRAVVDLALTHGRKHEAIAALHQVIGLTPDDMTAYYQLGEALSSMGEYAQAEKVYRRIVLMNPDDAIAQAKATAMAALKEQTTRE